MSVYVTGWGMCTAVPVAAQTTTRRATMAVSVTVSFEPVSMAMEAHCDACGALVASLPRKDQLETNYLSAHWFGLLHNGRLNHREAGCGDGAE